jgi:hypothetical protein
MSICFCEIKIVDNLFLRCFQNVMAAKTGVLGADVETESRVAERPRLNLKTRSNLIGQSNEIVVKER